MKKCVVGILLLLIMEDSLTHTPGSSVMLLLLQNLDNNTNHKNFLVILLFLSSLYGLFCELFRAGAVFLLSSLHDEVLITDHGSEDTNISLIIKSLNFN